MKKYFFLLLLLICFEESLASYSRSSGSQSSESTVQLLSAFRDEVTLINIQSGILYSLEGATADSNVLNDIDRNMTSIKNTVRGLEGFMDKLTKGNLKSGMSSSDALKPLP